MAHYDCEITAVWGQAVISLKSSEERDNVVAILLIAEVSPSSPRPALSSLLWLTGSSEDWTATPPPAPLPPRKSLHFCLQVRPTCSLEVLPDV